MRQPMLNPSAFCLLPTPAHTSLTIPILSRPFPQRAPHFFVDTSLTIGISTPFAPPTSSNLLSLFYLPFLVFIPIQ